MGFLTNLGKGFIRSAVNQVGRDGGRVLSNRIYGNKHSVPVSLSRSENSLSDFNSFILKMKEMKLSPYDKISIRRYEESLNMLESFPIESQKQEHFLEFALDFIDFTKKVSKISDDKLLEMRKLGFKSLELKIEEVKDSLNLDDLNLSNIISSNQSFIEEFKSVPEPFLLKVRRKSIWIAWPILTSVAFFTFDSELTANIIVWVGAAIFSGAIWSLFFYQPFVYIMSRIFQGKKIKEYKSLKKEVETKEMELSSLEKRRSFTLKMKDLVSSIYKSSEYTDIKI